MKIFLKPQTVLILLLSVFLLLFLAPNTFALTQPSAPGQLQNPLGAGNTDPRDIIGNIIRAILGIVGSLALAVFIFGGFTWITSAGNDEKVKKGKDMIIWASLGLAVIFFSYALVQFVIGAVAGG